MTEATPGSRSDRSGLAEEQAGEWTAGGRAAESLQDPEAHRAFVRALYAKLEARMAERLDADTQMELAELVRLLMTIPRKTVDKHRSAFETAFDLLATASPNILVIRSLRLYLAAAEQKDSSLLARVLYRVCGETSLTAVLAALASIFILSLLVLFAMHQGHQWLSGFYNLGMLPIGQLMLLVQAAFLGSIVSVIVRVRDFLHPAEFSPLLLYISVLSKPFVAITFAILAYCVLMAGLVASLGVELGGPQGPYFAWALGFLCGFSERVAQDFVIRASAKFGQAETPEVPPRNRA
jgi:hypothetical protein